MKNRSKILNKFFYKNEYQLLELAGVFGGFLIIFIALYFFLASKLFYFFIIFGLFIGSFGFIIEYFIKQDKLKAIESDYSYFLADLSKEYKKTNNMALSLSNLLESNFYGAFNSEIKKLATRVSWGESFEDSLIAINENINSTIIEHSLNLLFILKDSAVPYDKILLNISKDIKVFKSETRTKKYFDNLFNLSVFFYFLFIFALIYIDLIIGKNFLWFSLEKEMTRVFFDNFIMYVGLLLAFFTAFVMYSIKDEKPINLLKYVAILFLTTIILFQIFIPKPDADEVLIDTINYLNKHPEDKFVTINDIIAIKSLSSTFILNETKSDSIIFVNTNNNDVEEYGIIVDEPTFFNFIVDKKDDDNYVIYYTRSS